MLVDPSYTGMSPSAKMFQRQVVFPLPQQDDPQHGPVVPTHITLNLCRDPRALYEHIKNVGGGIDPILGVMGAKPGDVFITIDKEALQLEYQEW
eukprot:3060406-Ditylum_brightwellii.AAC.3